jgi:hypothetical protein
MVGSCASVARPIMVLSFPILKQRQYNTIRNDFLGVHTLCVHGCSHREWEKATSGLTENVDYKLRWQVHQPLVRCRRGALPCCYHDGIGPDADARKKRLSLRNYGKPYVFVLRLTHRQVGSWENNLLCGYMSYKVHKQTEQFISVPMRSALF